MFSRLSAARLPQPKYKLLSFGQQYFALREIGIMNATSGVTGEEISQAAKLSPTPWKTEEEMSLHEVYGDAQGRLWVNRAQFIYYMRQRGFLPDDLKTLNRLFSRWVM